MKGFDDVTMEGLDDVTMEGFDDVIMEGLDDVTHMGLNDTTTEWSVYLSHLLSKWNIIAERSLSLFVQLSPSCFCGLKAWPKDQPFKTIGGFLEWSWKTVLGQTSVIKYLAGLSVNGRFQLLGWVISLDCASVLALEDNMSECSFGSRADLDRLLEGPVPSWVQDGEGVTVTSTSGPSKTGMVRFIGPVLFAPGNWVGVELDQPEGE